MSLYYGLDGQPCSFEAGRALLESDLLRRIAWSEYDDGTVVSTVFLVIDYGFGQGPPVLWETVVFRPGGRYHGPERYTSEQAARDGHQRWCAVVEAEAAAQDT